jgi:hypothetical protein
MSLTEIYRIAQFIEPILQEAKGKSATDAPHIFIVAHGIFNSEFLGALYARNPPSMDPIEWEYSAMANTGWNRFEVGYADEFPADQKDGKDEVGTGDSRGAVEIDASGHITIQPTAVPAESPDLSGTTEQKTLPPLRVNVLAMNVSTHLDGVKGEQNRIESSAEDDDHKAFFGGGGH